MKILIVDDEYVSRVVLEKLLGGIYRCESVDNGEDALGSALSDAPPDLILLDVMMPGMNGYEVCQRLRDTPRTRDIPIIFLSGNTEVDDITRGFDSGAVDYITKPFHKVEVKARVKTHLSLKKVREDLAVKNNVLESQVREIQEKSEKLRQKDLQLIEMDRIAGIGDLAAGISHEINNPLSFIKSSIGFLNKGVDKMLAAITYWEDKPLPEQLQKDYRSYLSDINLDTLKDSLGTKFDRINRGIERIIKILNSLQKFSHINMETVGKMDINQSIEDAIEILRTAENRGVTFEKDFNEIPHLECNAREINQCLLHILKNAIDAVGESGIIKIETSYDDKNRLANIRIIDNGEGMSEEVLKKIFNPFYTTKAVGSGTGVGLSLTERILKRHNGSIHISSKEGEGTTVDMGLPAAMVFGTEQQDNLA